MCGGFFLRLNIYTFNLIKDLIIYQNHSNVVFSDHIEHVRLVCYLEYVYCTKNCMVTKQSASSRCISINQCTHTCMTQY